MPESGKIVIDLVLREVREVPLSIGSVNTGGGGINDPKRANARKSVIIDARSIFVPSFQVHVWCQASGLLRAGPGEEGGESAEHRNWCREMKVGGGDGGRNCKQREAKWNWIHKVVKGTELMNG